MTQIKKIALLTSGGDAPGMNACIRAVVRSGLHHGLRIVGIYRGYQGLIEGDFKDMTSRSVSDIIHRGGTVLKSARCEDFKTEEGQEKAYQYLKAARVDGLITIGGDGTFRGANEFSKKYAIPVIGIPGTIDNDMYGTDFTIGYDTAINTVLQNVDKIRDTAHSHNRLFFIEVMGRDAGLIALRTGIACGAEAILIPERKTDTEDLIENLQHAWMRKKTSSIVIVAEGDEAGGAFKIAEKVEEKLANRYEIRVTILGHIQRGGQPTCMDRVLASRLGVASVDALRSGKSNVMVGIENNIITHVPLEQCVKHRQFRAHDLIKIARILSY